MNKWTFGALLAFGLMVLACGAPQKNVDKSAPKKPAIPLVKMDVDWAMLASSDEASAATARALPIIRDALWETTKASGQTLAGLTANAKDYSSERKNDIYAPGNPDSKARIEVALKRKSIGEVIHVQVRFEAIASHRGDGWRPIRQQFVADLQIPADPSAETSGVSAALTETHSQIEAWLKEELKLQPGKGFPPAHKRYSQEDFIKAVDEDLASRRQLVQASLVAMMEVNNLQMKVKGELSKAKERFAAGEELPLDKVDGGFQKRLETMEAVSEHLALAGKAWKEIEDWRKVRRHLSDARKEIWKHKFLLRTELGTLDKILENKILR